MGAMSNNLPRRTAAILAAGLLAVGAPCRAAAPAAAREAEAAKGAARRGELAGKPAAFERASVLRCWGPRGESGVACVFGWQGRQYALAAAWPAAAPTALLEPAARGTTEGVRIALGRCAFAADGLSVLPVEKADGPCTPLTYAGPLLLKVGDRLAAVTRQAVVRGRLSKLSILVGDRVLPGEPKSRPMILEPDRPIDAPPAPGSPVVLVETGTLIGAVVGGRLGRTGFVEFELLRFGPPDATDAPLGRTAFGVAVPEDLPETVRNARRVLFPAGVCRFGPAAPVADLLAARPYLHRKETMGWEDLGRDRFFDSISYHWADRKVTSIHLETESSILRRPGRPEAGLIAMDWCVGLYGKPAAAQYANRRSILDKGIVYNVLFTWEPPGQAVFLLMTVKGPELTGSLMIGPRDTAVAKVLPDGQLKDIGIKPLDQFVAREFCRQWLLRTLSASPDHPLHRHQSATQPGTQPAPPGGSE